MDKRYQHYAQSCMNLTDERLKFYEELSPAGQAFVDRIAGQMLDRYQKISCGRGYGMGKLAARELAVAFLQRYWTGDLPAGFLMEVE